MIALVALLATAPPMPVAVVPLVVEGSKASVVDGVGASVADRVTLRLISSEELFVVGSGLDQQLADCGNDSGCIAARLRATRARLAFVVVVNELVSPPLVSVELLDIDGVESIGRIASRVDAAERDVSGAVRMRSAKLLDDYGLPPSSRVSIVVDPDDAEVRVDGEVPDDILDLVVAPGTRRVRASRDGFHPHEAQLECAAGAERSLSIALRPDINLFDSPWVWVGAGALVVAGVVVTIIALQPGPPCICAGPPDVPCASC